MPDGFAALRYAYGARRERTGVGLVGRPWKAVTCESACGGGHRCDGPGSLFVGITICGGTHDGDVVDEGRDERDRGGTPRRGVVDGDDRSVERAEFALGDVLRRRVPQWCRDRWSALTA